MRTNSKTRSLYNSINKRIYHWVFFSTIFELFFHWISSHALHFTRWFSSLNPPLNSLSFSPAFLFFLEWSNILRWTTDDCNCCSGQPSAYVLLLHCFSCCELVFCILNSAFRMKNRNSDTRLDNAQQTHARIKSDVLICMALATGYWDAAASTYSLKSDFKW